MHSSLPAPTKAQKRRIDLLKREVGCVACRLEQLEYVPPDVHHLLSGGRRISHDHTVPLCPWHHRGVPPDGYTSAATAELLHGPSMALAPLPFRIQYGTDAELLDLTNTMLAKVEESIVGRLAF